MNARAPYGEVHYQLCDLRSQPLPGHTFADCDPFHGDSLHHPLTWRGKPARIPQDSIVRLEIKMREAELFAVRGHFHFIDAQDMQMLKDGQTIAPTSLY